MLGCRAYPLEWREKGVCVERLAVFSLPFPLHSPLSISVTGACLLGGMKANGWIVRFCQPLGQSPFWSWKLQDVSETVEALDVQVNFNEICWETFKFDNKVILLS